MQFAVPLQEIPAVPIAGRTDWFPVRRVYTVGRNYAAHAAETGLGGADGPMPGFALKPPDSILPGDGTLPYPSSTQELDPEVELVVAIGRSGAEIPRETALEHVFGYAVGFDMIRRDVMRACIENQHSWDTCKSFRGASPIGAIAPAESIGHPESGAIWLHVNGSPRQEGDLSDLIWDVGEIVSRLSRLDRLEPGDLIYTGTPKGPAAVSRGDELHGHIDGIGDLTVTIS